MMLWSNINNDVRLVELAWKIETGLERGQLLPRKLRITVLLLEREKK
jgi:hypothetical protein